MIILISGKELDWDSLVIGGIDPSDYPDFCDAYVENACFEDGTWLTEEEVLMIPDDVAQELAFETLLD